MKGLPVDINALINAGNKLKEDREKPVKLVVLVEIDAADELLDALQSELTPKTARAMVDVAALEEGVALRVDSSVDAVVVVVGSATNGVAPVLADLRQRAIPTAVVGLRSDRDALRQLLGFPTDDVLVGDDATELVRGPLADWVMDRLKSKDVAVAHNFAFVRRAVAKESMKATAWQNAAIGAVSWVPGADMPLMTLNQSKMLLQMAAAYGEELGPERIWELGVVVGGGFVFRTIAREALGLIPGFGWALKAGVAYGGTIAMGEAAIGYFESGAKLPEVIDGLKERAKELGEQARERRREWSEERMRRLEGLRTPSGGYTVAPVEDELAVPGQLALPEPEVAAGAGGE